MPAVSIAPAVFLTIYNLSARGVICHVSPIADTTTDERGVDRTRRVARRRPHDRRPAGPNAVVAGPEPRGAGASRAAAPCPGATGVTVLSAGRPTSLGVGFAVTGDDDTLMGPETERGRRRRSRCPVRTVRPSVTLFEVSHAQSSATACRSIRGRTAGDGSLLLAVERLDHDGIGPQNTDPVAREGDVRPARSRADATTPTTYPHALRNGVVWRILTADQGNTLTTPGSGSGTDPLLNAGTTTRSNGDRRRVLSSERRQRLASRYSTGRRPLRRRPLRRQPL